MKGMNLKMNNPNLYAWPKEAGFELNRGKHKAHR